MHVIKLLRMEKGITQLQLATQLDVRENWISKVETGRIVPDDAMLKRISQYFKVPIEQLSGAKEVGKG